MSFVDFDNDAGWEAIRQSQKIISFGDHDLIVGLSRSVDELVVWGGGASDDLWSGSNPDPWADLHSQDDGNRYDGDSEISEFHADAFALSKVSGNDVFSKTAREVIAKLYKMALDKPDATWQGPLGMRLTAGELLTSLEKVSFQMVSQTISGNLAETIWSRDFSSATIYFKDINDYSFNKNYIVFHELAHALVDTAGLARQYYEDGRFSDIEHQNLEKLANEYGQVLAEIVGMPYPDDSWLAEHGGTFTR
ncbi:MAG: hypothetical protein ACK534_04880 [Phenylobacterium sp.]|jgi:hypothetical protein|uniref:hypothetical protein n=1 Tax=Phenylobacterium sp. TaxID=1871053 RepID=UPI00391FAB3E